MNTLPPSFRPTLLDWQGAQFPGWVLSGYGFPPRAALLYAEGRRPDLEPRELLEANLKIIKRVIRYFAYHFRLDDADDFEGDVLLKLVDNDYAVLRGFKGQSQLRTYISVVVERMALDRVGPRWRPSAEVQRLGPLAMELDKLLHRGRTLDEAIALLRQKHGESGESPEALAVKLPRPAPRPHAVPIDDVGPGDLSRPPDVDVRLLADERRRLGAKVSRVASAFIAGLPEQDRLILQLQYEGDVSVAQVARMFALDQKATYRRIERIYRGILRALERAGFTAGDILDLIGHDEIFIRLDFGNSDSRQSMLDDEKTGPPTEDL